MHDFLEERYDMLHDCGISAHERGKNLARSDRKTSGGSGVTIGNRLPWYTSGFE